MAVTDPGTPLEKLARERGFRDVFSAPPDVGGRYSALTPFGLVPAALLGVDINRLLSRTREMSGLCGPTREGEANPGLRLGAALGELALAGRDKVTFVTSHSIASLPDWIEQLVAESTGKLALLDGKTEAKPDGRHRGIVPVAGEPLGTPDAYGNDRFFAALLLKGDDVSAIEERLVALEEAGHPVGRFQLSDRYDLGAEMFRWEAATAMAGAVLGVNPFDQPDVQLAKELANKAMKGAVKASSKGEVELREGAGPGRRAGGVGGGSPARGLPGPPRLPGTHAAHDGAAPHPPGQAAREDAPRRHSRLWPALPPLHGPAPQGRPGPLPLPPARG